MGAGGGYADELPMQLQIKLQSHCCWQALNWLFNSSALDAQQAHTARCARPHRGCVESTAGALASASTDLVGCAELQSLACTMCHSVSVGALLAARP